MSNVNVSNRFEIPLNSLETIRSNTARDSNFFLFPWRFDITSVYRIMLYYIIIACVNYRHTRCVTAQRDDDRFDNLVLCSAIFTLVTDNDVLYTIYLFPTTCCRYQFFLQLKQDILQGRVPVTQELMAELGAYVVQCEYIHNDIIRR